MLEVLTGVRATTGDCFGQQASTPTTSIVRKVLPGKSARVALSCFLSGGCDQEKVNKGHIKIPTVQATYSSESGFSVASF